MTRNIDEKVIGAVLSIQEKRAVILIRKKDSYEKIEIDRQNKTFLHTSLTHIGYISEMTNFPDGYIFGHKKDKKN